jgi:hypothetical protein
VVLFIQTDEGRDGENLKDAPKVADTSRNVIQIANKQDNSSTDNWVYTVLSFPHFSI